LPFFIGLPFLLLGCGFTESAEATREVREIRHPDPELLTSTTSGLAGSPVAGTEGEARGADGLWRAITFPDDRAIGEEGGDGDEILGDIVDATVSGVDGGQLLVLDGSFGVLRVFDLEGRPLQVLGGLGDGPGEFPSPISIATWADRAIVVDEERLLHRFRWTDGAWSYTGRHSLAFYPLDGCLREDGPLILGTVPPGNDTTLIVTNLNTIHRLGSGGEIRESFSTPYGSDNLLVHEWYSVGRIDCKEETGQVWAAYARLGEVHGFDERGRQWITQVPDFLHPDGVEEPGRGFGPDPSSSERYDLLARLSGVSADLLSVSVFSRRMQDIVDGRQFEGTHRNYLLDASSGRVRAVVEGNFTVLGGGHGRAVLYRESPFPQIAVVDVTEDERDYPP
jgi:hypothetical protein